MTLPLTAVAPFADEVPTVRRTPEAPLPTPVDTRLLAPAAYQLARDELQRMRFLALFALVTAPIAGALLLFVPGPTWAALLHLVGLTVTTVSSGWFLLRVRAVVAYTRSRALWFAHAVVIGATSGLLFWGPFSALVMVVPLGSFILNQSRFRSLVASVAISGGAIHAGISLAMIGGVLSDPRPVVGFTGALGAQLAALILIQVILLASVAVALLARRAAVHAALAREQALQALARRDAAVADLRRELDQLRRSETPGRYSGETLGGYELGPVIGRGAMSEVYRGRRRRDGVAAAVKVLHRHALADPDLVQRFVQEARIGTQLVSPHLVRVIDVGGAGDPIPFLAMELLTGDSMEQYLAWRRTLPRRTLALDEVVELVRQVGRGLAVAHAAGITHRDLKPANVFRAVVDGRVVWKVLDFGVCRAPAALAERTASGMVVGTPQYMAPEQARGQRVDDRSDLYALAVIAYEALTGRAPFTGDDVPRLMHDIVFTAPPPPSALAPLPPDVDAVFAIALAKAPERRFPDADALADALAAASR